MVNRLTIPIKKQRLSEYTKKQSPTMHYNRYTLNVKTQKNKLGKAYTNMILI